LFRFSRPQTAPDRKKLYFPFKFSTPANHNGRVVLVRNPGAFAAFAMVSLVSLVTALTCGFAPPTWTGSQTTHDERLLGMIAPQGPAVIERFRQNMLTPAAEKDVRRLIDRLGVDDYRQRDKAHEELTLWRGGAEAILRQYYYDPNLERRHRVRQILEKGLGRWSHVQAEAAARLLRRFPSPEAVRVLIDYVPYADDAGVQREIAATLRDFRAQSKAFAAAIRTASADVRWKDMTALLALEKARETSPTLEALDLTRTFFSLVAQGESAKLADITRLPFTMGNGVILTSPSQRDDFFKQAIANYREANQNATLTFLHVTRGEEYLRFADDNEREFFSVIPADELRTVHVRLRRDWRNEEMGVVLIRTMPQGPVVVGLGHAGIRGVQGK
jgi:hypothetical protein